MAETESTQTVIENRKARYEYQIEDRIEAGIVLTGTEVKSLRQHRANLVEAFAVVRDGEVWLHGMHIAAYEAGNRWNVEPLRPRKLLLRKAEIRRLAQRVAPRGYTMIPLRVYFRDGYAKVELGICRGKRQYDKKEAIKERDQRRDLERTLSEGERRRR